MGFTRRICRSGIIVILTILFAQLTDAQFIRLGNIDRADTVGYTIYTDTNGVQQYFSWDSVLYDIYQIDTLGGAGDIGQVGFFTSSDATDFNSSTYQAIDWNNIQVNDTFAVSGSQIELVESGKYRLFTNLSLDIGGSGLSDIDIRFRKNGTTILPAAAIGWARSGNNVPIVITNETFDNSGSVGDYYEVVIKTDGGGTHSIELVDTASSFIISTVAGGSGPQGPAGTDGADGTDGVSVDTAYVLNDSLYIELDNGTTDGGYYVKGDKGDPGEDGVDGNVLDSNDWYLDTIITVNDSTYEFEVANRYGGAIEKTLTMTIPTAEAADPQVLTTSSITGGGRTDLDQGGGQFDIVGGTNSTVSVSGDEYEISSINNFANSLSFNTGNGILSLGRNGLSTLTTDLDGRYLTSAPSEWTLSSVLLYPNSTATNVLIGTTSNVFSSKLRVAGNASITRGTGAALTIADATGTNKKWEFAYGTSPNTTYADVRTNASTVWRYGVDGSGDFYFDTDGDGTNPDFVLEDDGDLVLDQYPNVRDDVSTAPINHLFTDAFGTIQSSPPGVHPFTYTTSDVTADKYDYIFQLDSQTGTSDIRLTLPSSPPTGKTYIVHAEVISTTTVDAVASGSTTIDGSSTYLLGSTSRLTGLWFFIYDGAGDYKVLRVLN